MIRQQCRIKLTADNSSLWNKMPKNFLFNWENNFPVTHCSICLRHFLFGSSAKGNRIRRFPSSFSKWINRFGERKKERLLQFELKSKSESRPESNCSINRQWQATYHCVFHCASFNICGITETRWWLLLTPVLGFKVRVDDSLPACNGFLRLTFGVTPTDLLTASMVAELSWSMYLYMYKHWWDSNPG